MLKEDLKIAYISAFRKLSQLGMKYEDIVIKNSCSIESIPKYMIRKQYKIRNLKKILK